MTVFSYSQLEGLWIQAGGSRSMAPLMAAIAMAESSGNSNATGGVGEKGLWQINPAAWDGLATYDPLGNARAAVHVLNVQGLGAWTTYTHGTYKQFLQGNVPPSASGAPANATLLSSNSPTGGGGTTGSPFGGSSNPLSIWNLLGIPDPVDVLERLGLVLLGAALILLGIYMLAGRQAFVLAGKLPASGEKQERETRERERRGREVATEQRRQRREVRQGEAGQRQNRALGLRERRVKLAEQVEARKRGELGALCR